MNRKRLKKNPKQKEALKKIAKNKVTLLEGGSRSGKTLILLFVIIVRCLLVPSRHLVTRFRFSHAKQAICYETMPKLLKILGIEKKVKLNKSEWFYEFPNKSTIWIGGLDDKERTEKILGNEYATILFNEASQISYESFEMTITRLNPPAGLRGKILIDYNPPSKKHWGYQIFHERKFPDGRPVPEDDFAHHKLNPQDNKHNSPEYMETLDLLSVNKRKRFKDGDYSDDLGSLWQRAWIQYNKDIPADLWRVVVAVDPTGSVQGDEAGIVAAGKREEYKYVLDDFSCHGTPAQWAAEAVACYWKWKADVMVCEKNFGGDMVKSTIQNVDPAVNVKLITSSRGKVVRAEPVSAQYERGEWYHRTLFNELEDEMCMYDPETSESPNRMDALVFAGNELESEGLSMLDVI